MPGHVPRKPSGTTARAAYFRWLHDQQKEQRISAGPGIQAHNTVAGKVLFATGRGKRGGAGVSTFKIRFAEDDYLVCRDWDGETVGSSDIYVAKPPELWCSVESEDIYGEEVTYTYAPDEAEPYMAFGDGGTWPGEEEEMYDVGEPLYQLRLNVVRTAVRDSVSEDQRVVKVWGKGQIIEAIEFDGGETAVGYTTDAGQAIEYLLLASNRNWARI
jgi:hypothetical protein